VSLLLVPEVRALLLLLHLGSATVWFGAVAYFLLVLRPAQRAAALPRPQWYALLRQVKARLRRVVGVSAVALVGSGALLAHARGFWSGPLLDAGWPRGAFAGKLLLGTLLLLAYALALPLIARIRAPRARAAAFVWTHVGALLFAATAAYLGLLLA
jgi:putative copper export protein